MILKARSTLYFVLLNLAITVPFAALLNIWIDEAYTLDTTGLGLAHAWVEAIRFENQPPLYFLLLALWRQLNDSIFFSRLFSCLCIALTIYCAPLLSRRYLPKLDPCWLTLSLALHPYAIWAALEIRTYALGILLSELLLICFFDAYLTTSPSLNVQSPNAQLAARQLPARQPVLNRAGIVYGLVAIAALYTNYMLGAILIANWVTLLLLKRRSEIFSNTVVLAIVGLLFAPMLMNLASQLASQTSALGSPRNSFLGTLRSVMGRSLLYVLPSEFSGWPALWTGIRYGVLALGLGLGIRRWRWFKEEQVAIASLFFTTLFTLVFVLDLTDHAAGVERYGYPLFVVTLLFVFSLLSLLSFRQRSLCVWAIVTCCFCAASLLQTYSPLAKGGDWQRVATYLETYEQANQPIAVFSAEGALPFKYHYKGINPILALPPLPVEGRYDLRNFVLKDETQVEAAIRGVRRSPSSAKAGTQSPDAQPPDAQPPELPEQFWLIEAPAHMVVRGSEKRCEIWQIDLNCQALDGFVARYYDVTEHQSFYDANVKKLRRKPVTVSDAVPDQVIPGEVIPDEIIPDEIIPDEIIPDEIIPDGVVSGGVIPGATAKSLLNRRRL